MKMASAEKRVSDANTLMEGSKPALVYVLDRRREGGIDLKYSNIYLKNYDTFTTKIKQDLGISEDESFVLTTTTREAISKDSLKYVEPGETLYVLQSTDQELLEQVQERVSFLPHYDTIVKGGMYEYYASEGQNPLPYAFAELIDNSLAATADNPDDRNIELRLHLDDNVILVTDNGRGMTSRQLNNWAVYRLSKFIRKERQCLGAETVEGNSDSWVPLISNAPRSLNSDISYFGVGGKQAIFFIGSSTCMISRPRGLQDVHELTISKDDFEEKEKKREAIYSGFIRNRKVGDSSHVSHSDEIVREAIKEEEGRDSFTTVVIMGVGQQHIPYLRNNFTQWTRQLAHIYHYYIHGPNGNIDCSVTDDSRKMDMVPDEWFAKINITIKMFTRGKEAQVVNLKDISDDMQSQYIRSSTSTFEFKATVEGTGRVEGVLRYHPFLYDRETYPSDANDPRSEPDPIEDEHDYAGPSETRPARGKRPIFECYWNGRLIPYTSIDEFDWCANPKKSKHLPIECYNRISGVLWTNDKFQVSTNKLTFIDLEMKLRDKNTAYARVIGKNEKRTDVSKEFFAWVKDCHETQDKQIKFCQFERSLMRPELVKARQGPWGVFGQIEWDNKVYKKGQLVRITKTLPYIYGTINRFLLFGQYDGDVYATGGEIEVVQEPKSLYCDVKLFPLSKLDRNVSLSVIHKFLEDEEAKLPDRLFVTWPEGDEIKPGEKRKAGKTVGDIKVEIANKKGEYISKLPGTRQSKLLIELKVIWHGPNGDEVIVQHISQHGKNWPYWFRRMEGNIKNLGQYVLSLQAVLNESGGQTFAGKNLPSHKIKFSVMEAEAEKFSVGMLEGPFRIGMAFQIPLEFQDEFGHLTKPSAQCKPILEASGLDISYKDVVVKGSQLLIKDIVALGTVPSSAGKSFGLVIRVAELGENSQTLKIRMLPGLPYSMVVSPDGPREIENGKTALYDVEVKDQAGNLTTQPRLAVNCKFHGAPGLPVYTLDCSSSGKGVLQGPPLFIKKIKGESEITAHIEVVGVKNVAPVERTIKVMPSSQASEMLLRYTNESGETVSIVDGQELFAVAGDSIKGLEFTLIDEAGRTLNMNDSLASVLKVNWTPKLSKEVVIKRKLPDIKVPSHVTESKYCHVSLADQSGVSFSFTVKPQIGEPAEIKCEFSGNNQVRLGAELQSDIMVKVKDKHGNEIKKFEKGVLKDLLISGEGLMVRETVRMLGHVSGFNIHSIKFDKSGSLGSRELCIKWRDLTDYLRVEILAGPPTKLSIPDWDTKQPVTVFNESELPQPLVVQLCDEADNPSAEPNVKVQVAKEASIKLSPPPQAVRTDAKGQANFGIFIVSGKRGVHELQPKAMVGRQTISGPKIKVSIQADSTKPVKLVVKYDKPVKYMVTEVLPGFTVKVLAEDDTVLTAAKANFLTMKISPNTEDTKPLARACTFSPDKSSDHTTGSFHFRNKKLPETSGSYSIVFKYKDGKHEVTQALDDIEVCAASAHSLQPVQAPGMPTVSNTKNQASRCLLRNLQLQLRDEYNNVTGEDVSGKLNVEVMDLSVDSNNRDELPCLLGNTHKLQIPISKGQATLTNLHLQENTPGKDGQEYILRCSLDASIPCADDIEPYDIPFLFYNDVKKQSQMAALSKERDNLMNAIKTYRSLFDTTSQLVKELQTSWEEAEADENKIRQELRALHIPANSISNVAATENLVMARSKQKEQIRTSSRRMCGLQPAPQEPNVLGKIAHLAEVKDSDIARVLSWHMSADMDCVVTHTTKKAQEIYKNSQGKQQVLPLDSIYRKNLPDWGKPLPHMRIRPNWKPAGNPVYARNLLQFPHHTDECRIVFGMLLGDTIILDSLEDANIYRQEIVKHTHCPTILTRGGDRVRSNGKFGGLMNRALPLEKLRGAVFSEPLPDSYHSVCAQIDLLESLKTAMQRTQSAREELDEQLTTQATPEMKTKHKELKEAEQQLNELEAKLGMNSARAAKRAIPDSASPPPVKKVRGASSNTPTMNGNSAQQPSRASLRRSAATPASPDFDYTIGKKRSRRGES